jgi:alkylation response protein AidB-like acyl-CoA dehydrogenase
MNSAQSGTTVLDAARALRPRLLDERDRIEADRRLPADVAKELAGAGLFRLSLPRAYGGLDRTPMESMEVFEELARTDASVAWCVWNGNAYWTAPQLSETAAAEIFSDPNLIVANSTQPKGRAVAVAGGYRVSGHWSLVSGCQISDWIQLNCLICDGEQPRLTGAGTPQLRFLFCRTADCRILDTWTAGGLRGTGSHDVVVHDVFVPEHHAAAFTDPPALADPRYRFPSWTREIPGLGAIALGIARGAIDALVELARAKRPERSAQTLSEDRGAQARVAQAEALVASARLFLFDAVARLWTDVASGGEPSVEGRAQVRLASCHALAGAVQTVDLAYLTGGATSLYTSSPLERAFRDVHAMTQHVAVHPRVMETVGRVLFGLEPETPIL